MSSTSCTKVSSLATDLIPVLRKVLFRLHHRNHHDFVNNSHSTEYMPVSKVQNVVHPHSAVVQLVEYQTRNQEVAGSTHTQSTASNLEQVANPLCAQAYSASYPQRDEK